MTEPASRIAGDAPPYTIILRLYVAGSAPNSQRAWQNLRILFEENLNANYELEIVDVLEEPLRALEDNVLLTPTLRKLAPPPMAQIVGDLSDGPSVLAALGIREHRHE